jgi:FkbM family methyltransferase
MLTATPFKSWALRFLPEFVLQRVRRTHYARKLLTAVKEPEMAVLRHLVPTGGCALDVGANFGLYTRFLAEAVGADGLVHAVEPVPPMYDVLRSNVRRLRLNQVRTHPVAVSDETRTVTMAVPRYATGGSNFYEARIVRRPAHIDVQTFRVPGLRLDDLFANLPRVDAVKVDVEGHELAVLRAAGTLIERHWPAWLVEVAGDPDDAETNAAELVELMRAEGYEIFCFDGRKVRPRLPGDRSVNYFFLRPEHLGRLPQELKVTTSGRTVPA